jgi:thiol-disulfide isomerase/thioredoxin
MKYLLNCLIVIFVFIPVILFAGEEYIVSFDINSRMDAGHEIGSALPLYKLFFSENGKFFHDGQNYDIVFPEMKNCQDTAFGTEFFEGWHEPPFNRNFSFIVANTAEEETYLWVDKNFNLDFSDDGEPFVLNKDNSEIFVRLNNFFNPEAFFMYKITKVKFLDSLHKAQVAEHFEYNEPDIGVVTIDIDNWLSRHRFSVVGKNIEINGDSVLIGLNDWNCNGTFNDIDTVSQNHFSSDRICFGQYGSSKLSINTWDGAIAYLPETIIKIGDQTYQVTEIEQSGKYIKFKMSNKEFKRVRKGDIVPDLQYELFNGTKTSLLSQLEKGKYNIIYIWATWCSGCIESLETMNNYNSNLKNELNIVGLLNWEGYDDKASAWIKDKKIDWTKGVSTPEICNTLLTGGAGGFMILVDKDLRIKKMNLNYRNLKEYIDLDK